MKRVFLSFKMENKKQVDGIRLMSWNQNIDLEFYDESVRAAYNSQNAAYIMGRIKEKIVRSSVTVGFLGLNTYLSEWVNWELATSVEMKKSIILMGLPNGPQELHVPQAVAGTQWWLWDPDRLHKMIEASP